MTQTTSRFFDELSKVMTNAAGAAQGVRQEVDALVQAQIERALGNLDVVQREEFEAVREMAVLARQQNQELAARIDALEAAAGKPKPRATKPRAAKPRSAKAAGKT